MPAAPAFNPAPTFPDMLQQRAATPLHNSLNAPLMRARHKKKSKKRIFLILAAGATGLVLLVGCGGLIGMIAMPIVLRSQLQASIDADLMAKIADSPDRPTWTADEHAVKQLGQEVAFDNFTMRLPTGYSVVTNYLQRPKPPLPAGSVVQNWTWVSKSSPNRRRVVVEAEIRRLPVGIDGNDYFPRELIPEIKAIRNRDMVSSIESGRLDGKRTVRVKRYAPEGAAHCFDIFRFDGNRMLNISVFCPSADFSGEPYLLDAAVSTLRENGGANSGP